MQLTTLALVAASALLSTSSALPQKTKYLPYSIENFGASHNPGGSSYATVSFYLTNNDTSLAIARTECVAQSITASNDMLGEFPANAPCANPNVTFTLAQNDNGRYYLEVMSQTMSKNFGGKHLFRRNATTYYEYPPGSGQKLERLAVKPNFNIAARTQGTD